jgi:hypothetical protein
MMGNLERRSLILLARLAGASKYNYRISAVAGMQNPIANAITVLNQLMETNKTSSIPSIIYFLGSLCIYTTCVLPAHGTLHAS